MIRLYRINTGSCGGCDMEIHMAVALDKNLGWANSPQEADVILLTGPITHGSRTALVSLLQEIGEVPLVAVGRCAIDGHPFGKGGVNELTKITVHAKLDGCPPSLDAIAAAIHDAARQSIALSH